MSAWDCPSPPVVGTGERAAGLMLPDADARYPKSARLREALASAVETGGIPDAARDLTPAAAAAPKASIHEEDQLDRLAVAAPAGDQQSRHRGAVADVEDPELRDGSVIERPG